MKTFWVSGFGPLAMADLTWASFSSVQPVVPTTTSTPWPIRVSTLFRLTDGTVNSMTTSVLSVVIWVRSSPASNASASCVSSALFTASTTCEPMRPFAPTTETLIMSSSLSTRTCPAMYPERFPIGNQPITAKPSRQYPRPQNQAPSDEPNREVELPLMSRTVKKTPEAFLGEGERQ